MPRPPAIIPNRHVHTTLPPELATRLELFLFSEAEQRVPKGAMQQFLIQRISEFFSHRSVDLSPFLRTNPGEVVVSGSDHSLSTLINHLKGGNASEAKSS